jgi:hypothetical protein
VDGGDVTVLLGDVLERDCRHGQLLQPAGSSRAPVSGR